MIEVKGCRVLLRPFKIQEHDKVWALAEKAGIALPPMSERKEQANIDRGEVLQIGPSAHKDYVGDIKNGDVIGFAKFGGKFIQDPVDDTLYLVINDEDVICVFKE